MLEEVRFVATTDLHYARPCWAETIRFTSGFT